MMCKEQDYTTLKSENNIYIYMSQSTVATDASEHTLMQMKKKGYISFPWRGDNEILPYDSYEAEYTLKLKWNERKLESSCM